MKQVVLFIFIVQYLFGFGQMRFEWINANILEESYEYNNEFIDYLLVHGNVKEIRQTANHIRGGVSNTLVKFDSVGNISYFQELSYPPGSIKISRFLEITYDYDSLNRKVSECKTEIIDDDTLFFRVRNSPNLPAPFLVDVIGKNKYGNSLITVIEKDTTFSTYDEFGRKTRDSIPFNRNTEGKINSYWYYTDSVYCEKSWSARYNVPSYREMYLIDEYGNWIEKRLYWNNDRNYTELFTRKIIYR